MCGGLKEVHILSRSSLEPGLKAISTQRMPRMWVDKGYSLQKSSYIGSEGERMRPSTVVPVAL